MKTTLEIPDDLYQQAKVRAAHENRKMKDLVSDGLRLVLGLNNKSTPKPTPVEDERTKLEGKLRRKALAVMEEIRMNPPYPPGRVEEVIAETNRLRKEGWNRGDLGE